MQYIKIDLVNACCIFDSNMVKTLYRVGEKHRHQWESIVSKHQAPKGFYFDGLGNLQDDRRNSDDRRGKTPKNVADSERRKFYRRKIDREIFDRDHRAMDEALEDFAEEHDQH